MATPIVSIIVPSRNKAKYVGKTLESILAQDMPDFEVLVFDNGSTDGSQDIIKSFSKRDARILFTQNPEDEGLVFSLNSGLARAKGRYVAVLHCDDLWQPNFLSSSIKLLAENPSAGMSICRYSNIGEDGRPHKIAPRNFFAGPSCLVPSSELFAHYISRDFSPVCCVLVTREAHEKCGKYDPQYPGPSDYQMWLKISSRMDGVYNSQSTSSYRIYGEQESGWMIDANVILLEQYSMAVKLFSSFIPKSPLAEAQKRALLRNTCLSALRQAVNAIAQGKGSVARSKCGFAIAIYGGLFEHSAAFAIYAASFLSFVIAPFLRAAIPLLLFIMKKFKLY